MARTADDDAFSYRRRRLRADLKTACEVAAKETGWTARQNLLVREHDGVFYAARAEPRLDEEVTDFTLEAKPMAIDSILWDILEMPEATEEPLHFRASGAFTCEGPSIAFRACPDRGLSAKAIASRLADFVVEESERAEKIMAHSSYAEFLSADPEQVESGAYGIPLFCAYVAEGDLARAWAFAEACAPPSLTPDEAECDFFYMALDWLSSARATKTVH